MTQPRSKEHDLRENQRRFRYACLIMLGLSGGALQVFEPGQIPAWSPFRASCGVVTGLPCLFCGMTRALHHLLEGNFASALYYNWLAFPILAGAFFLAVIFAGELIFNRQFFRFSNRWSLQPQHVALAAALLVSLWVLQIYLAISQQKGELLNPSGPLYVLFVQ